MRFVPRRPGPLPEVEMANQLGKIYVCTKCGAQVIVTKGGSGTLKCCGVPMELKRPDEKRERPPGDDGSAR